MPVGVEAAHRAGIRAVVLRKTWESDFVPGLPIYAIEAQNDWVAGQQQTSSGYETRILGTGVELKPAGGGHGVGGGSSLPADALGGSADSSVPTTSAERERGPDFFWKAGYVTLGRHSRLIGQKDPFSIILAVPRLAALLQPLGLKLRLLIAGDGPEDFVNVVSE